MKHIFTLGTTLLLTLCLLLNSCAGGTSSHQPDAALADDSSLQEALGETDDVESLPSSDNTSPASETEIEPETETTGPVEEDTTISTPEEPLVTLLLASDYQEAEGWPAPSETLSALLTTLKAEGVALDNAIFCGDYTNEPGLYNYEIAPDASIAEITALFTDFYPDCPAEELIFVQGNHDQMTAAISSSGLHEYEDYLVYVINTQTDFPWKQGALGLDALVENTAGQLEACLNDLIAAGETRPVLIAGHVPLHFSGRTSSLHSTGDNLYAATLFDVVNRAGQSLDCIYLFGHNHSKGWDSYLGGSCTYLASGDTILIPDSADGGANTDQFIPQTLQFTYFNPGYLGYVSDSGADDALTCTVCEIYSDRIVLTRYDPDGIHAMRSDGAANPYRDDSQMISSEHYASRLDSPQVIERFHAADPES